MAIPWPSERVSRIGLFEFVLAALALVLGSSVLHRWGLVYETASRIPLAVGLLALFVCGCLLYRLVKRREYPWIVALAAVALPFFQPSQTPFRGLADRALQGTWDLVLVGAAFFFLVQTMRTTDEMEQRVHLRALAWSYGVALALLIGYAVAEDLLPPLRSTWVASGMLGSWVVAWLTTSIRYQR